MRIVLAEDSVLLREGLIRLLTELRHEVVATAGTAPEAFEAVIANSPDVFITDVRMPPTHSDDGLRVAVELRKTRPQLPVLVLSQYVEAPYARLLLESGQGYVGYLLKDHVEDIDTFEDAISRIASGGTVLDPAVIAQLMVRQSAQDDLQNLTPREREVMELMAAGASNAAIASRLVISSGAVEKHIASIFAKLNLSLNGDGNRRVLAVLAWLQSK
jgi:DNA-binding NarL/FixJ family response regulator